MPNKKVINNILNLVETMEEGLYYIKNKLRGLNIEGSIGALTDLIAAFIEVEKSITPILEEISATGITQKSDNLRRAFDIIVKEYEENKGKKAYEILQLNLEPDFKKWKDELESVLRPYIIT